MKKTIGIFAHVDGGKTTFSEQILYHTNSIRNRGRVDHKNSYLDSHEIEKSRGITVFSDVGKFNYKDSEYYLIDTPGHIDFAQEVERCIGVLDYAILIISAVEGIQGHTDTIWNLLKHNNIPTFIFINKVDRVGANLNKIVDEIKLKFNENIIYMESYLNNELSLDFIEKIAESDEMLLEIYLDGDFNKELWIDKAKKLIKERELFVCYSGSALLDNGIVEFLEDFNKLTYTSYNKEGEFRGRVFKVKYDDKGNKMAFIKCLNGTIKTKDEISFKYFLEDYKEKINEIRSYNGNKFNVINEIVAGDIACILGVNHLKSGMALGFSEDLNYELIPTLKVKVIYDEKINSNEVFNIFKILESEDNTLNVKFDESLKELHIDIMGLVQIEVLKEVLKNRFNLNVDFDRPEILYKETIIGETLGYGHFEPLGHYSEVNLKIEEGERGSGINFINKCHADDLTVGNQNLIKTHIFEREHKGILTGSPITDLKITLITGRAHNKHTSGGDFREATKRALRQGLEKATNKVLEPYYKFKIDINIDLIGRVLSDIQKLKGEFNDPINNGDRVLITGRGPVKTFMDYSLEFLSFTKGKGILSLVFDGYDYCHNEDEVIEDKGYDKDCDIEYTSSSIFCSKGQAYVVEGIDATKYMHCLK
ncbi:TetM/TetW/TetO/TetS family tetracycline resistance ribosomal protection protein [Clostridium sp. Ade.TY]|uniref:elongation factor G n=1 Tax=Clostridium sp. Ade.TY TaxID=1391647 RepID=UPI000418FE77|nr:TetM/TetW/TetO/TetS family tetracycline resistance ribosomal protection protein [Clostridium sp. Ade.TY]